MTTHRERKPQLCLDADNAFVVGQFDLILQPADAMQRFRGQRTDVD